MNVCVFIPSHIKNQDQIKLLEKCISSVESQLPGKYNKLDIYVSISFENKTLKKHTASIIKQHNKTLFCQRNKQLFQMEHIYELYREFAHNYDLILFLTMMMRTIASV